MPAIPSRCRHFSDASEASQASADADAASPLQLFRARSLKAESKDVETAISLATFGMASGMGAAFLGLAPLVSPALFMVGLLLAIVQVQFGYSFLMRNLWLQRRRWVTELYQNQENGQITVVYDAKLRRIWNVDPDGKNTMQEIAERGQRFFFLDQEMGEVLQKEALQTLLSSSQHVKPYEVVAEPVMGETAEQSKQLLPPFPTEKLSEDKDATNDAHAASPVQQLNNLERYARVTGFSFMTTGFIFYILGNWSAQSVIDERAKTYTPGQPPRQVPLPPGRAAPGASVRA